MRWYALIYLFVALGLPLRAGLRALEYTRPIFWAYVIATLFSVTFAQALVTGLGLAGVMVGLLLSQVLMQVVLLFAFAKNMRSISLLAMLRK